MKAEGRMQRLMNTANYKSVSGSSRLTVEKSFKCKAFDGIH